jgi:hypothetical protein
VTGETLIALIGALGGLIAIVVTSLRKREDTELEELRRDNKRLKTRVTELEVERDAAHDRAEVHKLANVTARSQLHRVRLVLADNGIDDPTTL